MSRESFEKLIKLIDPGVDLTTGRCGQYEDVYENYDVYEAYEIWKKYTHPPTRAGSAAAGAGGAAMNIDDLELTIRSDNGLKAAGITTVEQLVELDWEQLNNIKNVGQKSISEICWACISLLNGRMTERRLDWERRWPSNGDNLKELREKAKKYDAIANIIGS